MLFDLAKKENRKIMIYMVYCKVAPKDCSSTQGVYVLEDPYDCQVCCSLPLL